MELIAENEWIENEERFFGQPNTNFDFTGFVAKDATTRLRKLEALIDDGKNRVNFNVDAMFDD